MPSAAGAGRAADARDAKVLYPIVMVPPTG